MKKCLLFVCFSLLALLVSCAYNEVKLEHTGVDSTTAIFENNDFTFANLPVHRPEDIRGEYWSFTPTYRSIFYSLDGVYGELINTDQYIEFIETINIECTFYERDEMLLVVFIQHFQIAREDFERAVVQQWKNQHFFGFDEISEGAELPCPDIIFTFDNDIINAFYRRENPVAPDWWPVER